MILTTPFFALIILLAIILVLVIVQSTFNVVFIPNLYVSQILKEGLKKKTILRVCSLNFFIINSCYVFIINSHQVLVINDFFSLFPLGSREKLQRSPIDYQYGTSFGETDTISV